MWMKMEWGAVGVVGLKKRIATPSVIGHVAQQRLWAEESEGR